MEEKNIIIGSEYEFYSKDLESVIAFVRDTFTDKNDKEREIILRRAADQIAKGHYELKGEEWKPIEGWPNWFVSNYGNVRWAYSPRNMKGYYSSGYRYIELFHDDEETRERKKQRKAIHRLVAEAFIPCENPEGMVVNHKNEVRSDNNVTNLEWLTHAENIRYSKASTSYRIYLYDAEGNIVADYKSVRDAVRRHRPQPSGARIYDCIHHPRKSHQGLYYRKSPDCSEEVVKIAAEKGNRVNAGRRAHQGAVTLDDYNAAYSEIVAEGGHPSQGKIAERLGVTRQTIWRLKNA